MANVVGRRALVGKCDGRGANGGPHEAPAAKVSFEVLTRPKHCHLGLPLVDLAAKDKTDAAPEVCRRLHAVGKNHPRLHVLQL